MFSLLHFKKNTSLSTVISFQLRCIDYGKYSFYDSLVIYRILIYDRLSATVPVPSHHRRTLLQRAHHRDEHVLVRGLEQASQQRDPPGLSDGLLVPGGLAAAPKSQSAAASHLDVPLLVRR